MKKYLLLFFTIFTLTGYSQGFISCFDQLVQVNEQWLYQKDVDAALQYTAAKPLSEQQLVQFHLQEAEKLLRKRNVASLSAAHQKARMYNLNMLHKYMMKGVFPVNDRHENRQPYFIDKYNTYCAVGYLMQQSGSDDMARSIHATQNYSYLFDIAHPKLMDWAAQSGLMLDELALIQPGYPGDWPCAVIEIHYNNTGTDVNEYIEVHESTAQGTGQPSFKEALLYNENGILYKTILKADMLPTSAGYYYLFPSTDSFANKGKIILRGNPSFSNIDTISITKYSDTSVDVNDPNAYSSPIKNRHYSVGESETTPVGTSLAYCGFYSDTNWSLQSKSATIGYPDPCTILPVRLGNFSYSLLNKKVTLNWETLSESNTKFFSIERSIDGTYFTAIGKTNATGNTTEKKKYAFADETPRYINHYRIKQIDADGQFTYTKILFVKVPKASPIEVIQPGTEDGLRVYIHLEQGAIGSIVLYDFSGRIVQKFKVVEGSQTLAIKALLPGSYLLQLITKDGSTYNSQLIK